MTSALFGTSKLSTCSSCYLHLFLAKYFHLAIHQCSISMGFSLFLGTAYILPCNNGIAIAGLQLVGYPNISAVLNWRFVQTHKVQITVWCLSLHKEEIQNAPEGPVFDPVLENFPLTGGRSAAPPTPPRNNSRWHQHSQNQGYATAHNWKNIDRLKYVLSLCVYEIGCLTSTCNPPIHCYPHSLYA